MKYPLKTIDAVRGMISALIIIAVWLSSLIFALTIHIEHLAVWLIILMIIWQTFLYTGLFITAHDAMHGTAFFKNKNINKIIGMLAVLLYAMFSYKKLLTKHHQHHKSPGTQDDPDFHDGIHKGFWKWYIHFLLTYLTWIQFLIMAVIFNVLFYLLNLPLTNIILFWILPSVLSTLQLFYFGTFLPHREMNDEFIDQHRARSNDYNILLSFLTCYHFGYHWEHHEFPYVPWWKLPRVRKQTVFVL